MSIRSAAASILFLALVTLCAGCPAQGNRAAGIWHMNLDTGCDSLDPIDPGMVLSTNGSAAFYAGVEYLGVWSLDGSTVTIHIVNPVEIQFTGALSLDSNTISNGTLAGDADGCWTAERVDI